MLLVLLAFVLKNGGKVAIFRIVKKEREGIAVAESLRGKRLAVLAPLAASSR
jgi:hypothetical protein